MVPHRRVRSLVFCLAAALIAGFLSSDAGGAPRIFAGETTAPVLPPIADIASKPPDGKLVEPLPALAEGSIADQLDTGDEASITALVDANGSVGRTATDLLALGANVVRIDTELSVVQVDIPVAMLSQAAALTSVTRIRPRDVPTLNVTTEGDAILDADDLRSSYAVSGGGVRVGVISDGLEGLAAAQSSGELPAVNSTTCDAVSFAPAGQPANPTDPGAGAEGTAMLEIVHDMAPDAELWFGYFGFNVTTSTSLDYMQAVDCLAQNVDIVIDNVTYLDNGPYDGTSPVSQNLATELNKPVNRIRGYYNAVGSVARQHYQEAFVDSGFTITAGSNVWTVHRFQATSTTTDGGQGAQCHVNPVFGYCGDRVFLPAGETLRVGLQWDDPWGASPNDYDVFLLNENTSQLILIGANEQNGNDNPVEEFTWTNATSNTQPLSIFIGRLSGATKVLDMFVLCEDCTPITGNAHNFNTISSSVLNNADAAGGVVSIGAINADEPGNDDIAPYSSRGPTNDGRTKPDAVAIDEVSVSGAGGFSSPFIGTSASAPHAGAIAALVLSCRPQLKHGEAGDNPADDRTTLRSALTSSSVDLGVAGNDNTNGNGRLDADAAAGAAGCALDTDGDGVPQFADNCPGTANPAQENNDRNFIDHSPPYAPGVDDKTAPNSDAAGDACDTDDDNDGHSDADEASGAACGAFGPTNALLRDTDGDRFLDGAECARGTDPTVFASKPLVTACGATTDADGDKLNERIEVCFYGTDPANSDTDGDKALDGAKDGCEAASFNGDRIVNVADMGMLATAIGNVAFRVVSVDVNKDGVWNPADQGLVASFISPSGQCPG